MRLRLNPAPVSLWACLVLAAVTLLGAGLPTSVSADDRMVLRGSYYREDSTRVLAPSVSYRKDIPDERLNLGVEYLLDSISSASIGSGAAVLGGDKVFRELRHQVTPAVSSKLGPWGLGGYFRYSNETDYTAHTAGFGVSREFLQKTLNFSVNYAYTFDRVYRILNNVGARSPWKSNVINDAGEPVEGDTNLLEVHYLNLGYGHVYGKHVLGGVNVELSRATGPQDNPYRKVRNGEPETHPLLRYRMAPSTYLLWSIPKARMVLEPRYRYYFDDWNVKAHALDMRVHFRPTRHFRFRLRYRYYTQTGAFFYLEDGAYEPGDRYKTADPKLWEFHSHTPGVQITYELDGLARHRGLEWLSGAWIEATYNHIFRRSPDGGLDPRFGNARMGSLAFSLGF